MSGHGNGRSRSHHEEEHEEHGNHEAWVIPYADVLTLLMALFLVLWALGNPDKKKTDAAAESFRRSMGGVGGISPFDVGLGEAGGPVAEGGVSILEGVGITPEKEKDNPAELAFTDPKSFDLKGQLTDELGGDPLTQVEQVVRDAALGSGLTTVVGARRESRGLVVTIVSDQVLFSPGQAEIQPGGTEILKVVADSLRNMPNSIIVEGHTDSRPISTPRFPSNWELSTARASSVVRYFIDVGKLDAKRISAGGYADVRPVASGTDAASLAKNRRVEIVVLATKSPR